LLCVERSSFIKRIYRFFLDNAEELSLYFTSTIVVNSGFTLQIFKESFKILQKLKIKDPKILYPAIELEKFDKVSSNESLFPYPFFVSLNRYERKKNI
jgi:alpha-1,3/alpha-1,6-mannosyltransferase